MTTLRPLAWPDIPRLVELEAELFPLDAWTAATWWAELAERPRREYVVVVDHEGAIVGYAGLDRGGDVADVMTLATAAPAQGAGLGRRLLGELEARARRDGAQAMVLEVRADNAAARHIYAAAGFEIVQTRRRYYHPGDVDALVMRKLLSDSEHRP